MAKRKRKGLGSAPRAHEGRAAAALRLASVETKHVKRALDKGHCSAAFASLASAAADFGAYNAEIRSAGNSPGTEANRISNAYGDQKSRFRAMCLK